MESDFEVQTVHVNVSPFIVRWGVAYSKVDAVWIVIFRGDLSMGE